MDQQQKQLNYQLAEKLVAEQNIWGAAIFGAAAMVLAAVAYGLIGAGGFTYSFVAVGIGVFVGLTMQFLGRGIDARFPVLASVYTVGGCLLGNMFTIIIYIARAEKVSPFKILLDTPPNELLEWSGSGVQLISLIFWTFAVVAAIFFVKRPLTREERLALGMYEMRRRSKDFDEFR
jgi:hypothetical protein